MAGMVAIPVSTPSLRTAAEVVVPDILADRVAPRVVALGLIPLKVLERPSKAMQAPVVLLQKGMLLVVAAVVQAGLGQEECTLQMGTTPARHPEAAVGLAWPMTSLAHLPFMGVEEVAAPIQTLLPRPLVVLVESAGVEPELVQTSDKARQV